MALVAGLAGMAAAVAELAERNADKIEAIGWTVAGLALAVSILVNGRLGERLVLRDRRLADGAVMIELAEKLAHFGRWQAFPDGRQEWSAGLLAITGFPPGLMPDQETRRELLPDGGKRFYGSIKAHAEDREPYHFDFEIDRVDGERRCFRVVAQNVFDFDGNVRRRLGVAIDVTDDQRKIEQLGEACGEAMKRVQAALALADSDPLTGLPNRRRAMAELDRAILRAGRNEQPLALALFDIDHFKAVNDTHGHAAGDAVLSRIGEIAKKTRRDSDLVGRIGGEEFLWILPEADFAEARRASERLRKAIAERSAAGGAPPVTASIGLAIWRPGEAPLALFARADEALYAAKNAGRNTIRKSA